MATSCLPSSVVQSSSPPTHPAAAGGQPITTSAASLSMITSILEVEFGVLQAQINILSDWIKSQFGVELINQQSPFYKARIERNPEQVKQLTDSLSLLVVFNNIRTGATERAPSPDPPPAQPEIQPFSSTEEIDIEDDVKIENSSHLLPTHGLLNEQDKGPLSRATQPEGLFPRNQEVIAPNIRTADARSEGEVEEDNAVLAVQVLQPDNVKQEEDDCIIIVSERLNPGILETEAEAESMDPLQLPSSSSRAPITKLRPRRTVIAEPRPPPTDAYSSSHLTLRHYSRTQQPATATAPTQPTSSRIRPSISSTTDWRHHRLKSRFFSSTVNHGNSNSSSSSSSLRKSMTKRKSKHTVVGNFGCPICQKMFRKKATMVRHMDLHTNRNSFSCAFCPRTFTYKHNLKQHEHVHTGEKPFECPECKKSFTTGRYLKEHVVRRRCNGGEAEVVVDDDDDRVGVGSGGGGGGEEVYREGGVGGQRGRAVEEDVKILPD